MWGTQGYNRVGSQIRRFTPTHVGNTKLQLSLSPQLTVHPHACGEHVYSVEVYEDASGSPPRMWGTPTYPRYLRARVRFTPTHVGNTDMHHTIRWQRSVHPHACGEHSRGGYIHVGKPVHPHACGEHVVPDALRLYSIGSPPRMWGTRDYFFLQFWRQRFTPTHVGNTGFLAAFAPVAAVHPHACGEHVPAVQL